MLALPKRTKQSGTLTKMDCKEKIEERINHLIRIGTFTKQNTPGTKSDSDLHHATMKSVESWHKNQIGLET
jgi:hypothetical protein